MKKIITYILLVLFLFLLTSCGKTRFEDLSKDKQIEIQTQIQKDILAPYITDVMGLAFQNINKTEDETNKIMDQKVEEMKQKLKSYLEINYPNIEFDIDKISKIDNSKKEIEKKEEKKYTNIKLGEYYTFIDQEDKDKIIKLKVNKDNILWKGQNFTDGYLQYTAKNEFLLIRLESENIGKKPTFQSFSNTKLITKDGIEYGLNETMQVSSPQSGFGGCIECDNNPGDKAEQDVVFDIKKIDLTGAKLRFENELVDFEL